MAILFAAATAVPAWSRLSAAGGLGKEQLAPAIIFFALLCWINCVGIEKWEGGNLYATTRWASLHLRPIVTMIALFSFAAALLAPTRGLAMLYLAALISSALLFALDAHSSQLSPLHLRIAADAALLTPAGLVPICPMSLLPEQPFSQTPAFARQRRECPKAGQFRSPRSPLPMARIHELWTMASPLPERPTCTSHRCAPRFAVGRWGRTLPGASAGGQFDRSLRTSSTPAVPCSTILERRIRRSGPQARRRICLHRADALEWNPTGRYDLIVSHFFLDCFSTQQLEQLFDGVLPHALPGAQWVISEFAIPRNAFAAYLARRIIRLLYQVFGWTTGLPVRALPDYATGLFRRGLVLSHERRYLVGLLCSQVWRLPAFPHKNELECRMPYLHLRALLVFPLLLASSAWGQVTAVNSPDGKALSKRIAAYWIDASVNTDAKSLDASEVVEYRNPSDHPVSTIPFHLYLNAFRPQSTFSREAHQDGLHVSRAQGEQGSIDIKSIAAEGYGDLSQSMRFIAPDDGNQDDHTVMEVTLPKPLAPTEAIRFQIAFHDKFPLAVARSGYKRDFIMGAQWFPKVGVLWNGVWNCHQYHVDTEFFSDFGTYNVNLTLPQRYIVGASGIQTAEQANSDGTRTLSFRGEDIHDFAWAASPHFQVADDVFVNSLGPVKLHALVLASHAAQRDRYLSILKQTMQKYDEWYGPYPYKQITLDRSRTRLCGRRDGISDAHHRWRRLARAVVVSLRHGNHGGPRIRPSVLVWHGRQQ